jgi:hypothetical protein
MTKPTSTLTDLLERMECELQTPDGRIVRVCRDANGREWVVDHAERIVPLSEFALGCSVAAQEYYHRAHAEEMRRLARVLKEAFARVAQRLQRLGARVAHA